MQDHLFADLFKLFVHSENMENKSIDLFWLIWQNIDKIVVSFQVQFSFFDASERSTRSNFVGNIRTLGIT